MHTTETKPLIHGHTITRDLILWLSGIIIAILSCLGIWYQVHSSSRLEKELHSEADILVEEIGAVLTLPLQNLNYSTIRSIGETYLNAQGLIAGILIETDFGDIVFSAIPPDTANLLLREKRLTFQGIKIGSIQLWLSDRELHKKQRETIKTGFLISLLIIGIIMLGTYLFMRFWLSKPLKSLIQGIRRIAQGDYSKPLPPTPQAEISAIAHEVNRMAVEISLKKMQLEESERKYRSIFENATEGIFQSTADGRFLTANRSMAKILDYATPDELMKSITDIPRQLYVDHQERERLCSLLEQHDTVSGFEAQFYKKDKTAIWISINARTIKDENGKIAMIEGLLEDITEQRRMREALASEKERLAVTLNSIGDGVISTDTTGHIVMLNKVAAKLTGWKQEEAVGMAFDDVFQMIDKKTEERHQSPVLKVVESGQIVDLANDTILVARDGSKRIIAESGAPIRDRESNIVGVVLVFRDVTEERKIAEELIKVRKLESVGLLAGGIAHDFNNILVAILGNINLAMLKTSPDDIVHTLLAEAEKASIRAKDLTQQLLTFSKGGEPVKKIASIAEVIKESSDFVLRGSSVRCDYQFTEDLWPVEIDTGQISQVIQNLIINSNHAMPEGGIIDVHCENFHNDSTHAALLPQAHYVKITIKDRGIGIPAHLLENIFDPYFSTKQKGSGLGLAVTHSIITKHGGTISVESEQGVGTTFTIYLPASPQTELKATPAGSRKPEVAGKLRVMVMDDDEMVRSVAQNMLSTFGYITILAKDGEEAINLYQKSLDSDEKIDVIVMDLTIPGGMGGKEAVQGILTLNKDAKVIVASGYSNDPVMSNYREYGFSGIIVKPFHLKEFHEGLIKVLEQ